MVIDGDCFRLVYCKVLLRSLLVLAVLVLGYVLVGVAPASALAATWDIAVVRGTDNHLYWNSYNSVPSWGSWQSLGGATLSPPGICEVLGFGEVWVVVRGTDNGIYLKYWYAGTWSGWISPTGGGATIDQPACAYLYPFLHIVVRGGGNELYSNSYNGVWSGWHDLHGKSSSSPVLVSTPLLNRIDLVVQGTDNGIYHKAYTSGAWSSSWDSPGGKTLSKPAATLFTDVLGCATGCVERDQLRLVVRGTDNNVYSNIYEILPYTGWGMDMVWISLSGATLSAPTLAYDANGCSPGTLINCASIAALAVRGTDNAVYHKTLSNNAWSGSWDSPGGSITNSPALAYVPGSSAQFLLLVQGSSNNKLYSNTVTGSTWSTYSSVGGATNSDPALVAVL
jgi:hypothetical protein